MNIVITKNRITEKINNVKKNKKKQVENVTRGRGGASNGGRREVNKRKQNIKMKTPKKNRKQDIKHYEKDITEKERWEKELKDIIKE